MATYVPDGYIVVYAIDDSESLQEAERILSYLKSEEIAKGTTTHECP